MKNTTLAMVAVLAAVAMLSAGLAVPMQQAIASDRGGDEYSKDFKIKDGGGDEYSKDFKIKDGGGDENSIDSEIWQENNCGENEDLAVTTCSNLATVTNAPILSP
jgi:hypothetical protein